MEKTKFEEMMDRLPSNVKETNVLRLSSKKVLAALLDLMLHSEARESRVIYCQNSRLRKISGVGSNELLTSLQQLIDYDLITRKVGTVRKEGEKGEASEYTINFKKLKEPIVEKTFDDLFSEFLEDTESLEKPISTAISTTITTSTTTAIATSSAIASTNSIINSNTMTNTNSNKIEKQFEIDKEILLNKIEEATDGLDFNAIESVKIPLNDFITSTFSNEIERLKRILNNTLEKKKEKLKDTILEEAMSSSSTVDELPF